MDVSSSALGRRPMGGELFAMDGVYWFPGGADHQIGFI
jgi:hypothetical protein